MLFDLENPFYIGKGTKNRMYEHYKRATKTKIKSPVLDKIRNIILNNRQVIYKKIFESDIESNVIKKEINTILEIGRRDLKTGPLLNLTDGGEGVTNYIWSKKHKKNLSKSIKKAIKEGRYNPPGNIILREEKYKKTMSKKIQEYWNSEEGKKHKKRISVKNKKKLDDGKRVLSKKARQKMRESALRTNKIKKQKLKWSRGRGETKVDRLSSAKTATFVQIKSGPQQNMPS